MRNLNPLVAVFGLPAWDTVPIGSRFGATAEVANHYRFSLEDNERLMLDGETVRTNLAFTHGFASGWSLGIEVPVLQGQRRRVGRTPSTAGTPRSACPTEAATRAPRASCTTPSASR